MVMLKNAQRAERKQCEAAVVVLDEERIAQMTDGRLLIYSLVVEVMISAIVVAVNSIQLSPRAGQSSNPTLGVLGPNEAGRSRCRMTWNSAFFGPWHPNRK